jgi:VWFA-related protein
MSYRDVAILAILAAVGHAQGQPASDSHILLRSTAQEVLFDFIARDKHQKLITDLHAEDIEILEDGVPQKLKSFRYRNGRNEPALTGPAASPSPGQRGQRYAALSQINVVSLVFEALGPESRRQAAQAAKDFLASEAGPDTYVGVFTLNHRLALLQQYTNDLSLLNKAVERAAGGAYQQFAKEMGNVIMRLNSIAGDPAQFQAIQPGSAEERGPVAPDTGYAQFLQHEREMAQLALSIVVNQAGNQSIDALEQLIRVQAQIPGRKTIIYFSEGLIVPPEQPERYRAMISAANRANISFYTVDPSGLDTTSRVRVSALTTRAMRAADAQSGAAVKPTNYQENLRELAEDTGGFWITDTNDTRVGLRRVMEEVRAHYEASYAPTSSNYDGRFRTIEIRSHRPGLRLQGRKGYFALPVLDGEAVAPFELPLLAALDKESPPRAFDFHAGVLAFRATGDETEYRVVFSVPSRALRFTEDSQTKLFHIHVSFLALVKDDRNQVVRKLSRDLPFQAPTTRRAEFESGEVTVTLPLRLPPGRYHLEAVASDRDGDAASTRKVALTVSSPKALTRLALSDLVLVRSVQPASEDRDLTDPLEFAGGKATPEMSSTIAKSNGGGGAVYFVLYPQAGATPAVRIDVLHNGAPVTSARLNLPVPEADGSLRVVAPIAFSGLDPGVYEVVVTGEAGGAVVRGSISVQVE